MSEPSAESWLEVQLERDLERVEDEVLAEQLTDLLTKIRELLRLGDLLPRRELRWLFDVQLELAYELADGLPDPVLREQWKARVREYLE